MPVGELNGLNAKRATDIVLLNSCLPERLRSLFVDRAIPSWLPGFQIPCFAPATSRFPAFVAFPLLCRMNSYFTELGRSILSQWRDRNFSLQEFPELAASALKNSPPVKKVNLAELVREFLLNDEQPFQSQSGFGQPELIVYDNPRFYIQALFWLDGTTDIHQHMFSGAFHVLQGSSIHSRFAFDDAQSISAHLRVGNLRVLSTELLETGHTVPIVSGRGYIHSLFHLDTPSITIVVRTHTDPGTGPQFTYLPPHLAVDPDHYDTLTLRRKQLLDALEVTNDPSYPKLVAKMIRQLDFERGFFILQNGMGYLRSIDRWDETWAVFAKKHGKLSELVEPTLDEIIRRDGMVALRGEVTEVEHRFFLALLLNVPTRKEILSMVGKRFPGSPAKTVLRWIEELMDVSDFGTTILDAHFPGELEVNGTRQPKVLLSALRHFVEGGKSTGTGGASRKSKASLLDADLERLRGSLRNSSLRPLVSV
jgi:hypothetical protein